MFTGLVREVGEVLSTRGNTIFIKSSIPASVGDSIAVNGVCLTVTESGEDGFWVEAADETRRIVPPEKLEGRVHLEAAMSMNDRFEGHIVQGHVDTVGVIEDIQKGENAVEFIVRVEPEYIRYIVPKGSIAIDGISLTVNEVFDSSFRLTVIPHTMRNTLISEYEKGSRVNIETDLFARYIEHILSHRKSAPPVGWRDIDAMQMSF